MDMPMVLRYRDATMSRPGSTSSHPGSRTAASSELPPIQIFGQPELVEHLRSGGAHHTHCVSIGNPYAFFFPSRPDAKMPRELREHFEKVLRLSFYDVEERRHLRSQQFPKRIPKRADTRSTAGRGYRDRPRSHWATST